jgi:pheromone receptor transcription factor
MADLGDHQTSPTDLEESQSIVGNNEPRGIKRQRASIGDDDSDEGDKNGRERRKIEIKFISDKSRRHITFSKRKAGIMKKAYELSVLTGTQVLLLVVSETGLVYTFTTPKLQPLVTKAEGKNLIQACLNAPEPSSAGDNGADDATQDSPDDTTGGPPIVPQPPQATMPPAPHMPPSNYMPVDAMAYQTYLQQQQHQAPPHPQQPNPQHPQQQQQQPRPSVAYGMPPGPPPTHPGPHAGPSH